MTKAYLLIACSVLSLASAASIRGANKVLSLSSNVGTGKILSAAALTPTSDTRGFDWGDADSCSAGSGSFKQLVADKAVVMVGKIPSGKANIRIDLTSNVDVDIQLFQGDHAIVAYPNGELNGPEKSSLDYQSSLYNPLKITYSGYNGLSQGENDWDKLGHEYITIEGRLDTDLVMKVYGFEAGEASVEYSWSRPLCCEYGFGSGAFKQQVAQDAAVEVGVIPAGKGGIEVLLDSKNDVDIQLFDSNGVALVAYMEGKIGGATQESLEWNGVTIHYSGYNGAGTGSYGTEWLTIEGVLKQDVIVKAFGYAAGEAKVEYMWGVQHLLPKKCSYAFPEEGDEEYEHGGGSGSGSGSDDDYEGWYGDGVLEQN